MADAKKNLEDIVIIAGIKNAEQALTTHLLSGLGGGLKTDVVKLVAGYFLVKESENRLMRLTGDAFILDAIENILVSLGLPIVSGGVPEKVGSHEIYV